MKVQVLLATVSLACAGFGAGYPSDLVFYSTLDSESSIKSPAVGAAGTCNDATFQTGKYGNALYRPAHDDYTVEFPLAEGLPVEKGCIEFCAKILKEGSSYEVQDPSFMVLRTSDHGSVLGFFYICANDGAGGHGLTGNMPAGAMTTLSGYGSSYPYSTVFGEADAKAWHHYAIVWNTNGVAGSSQSVRLYLDGVIQGSVEKTDCDYGASYVSKATQSMRLNFSETHSDFLIDELRIWSTDRTTFPEGPINPDVVPPVVSEVTAKQHYPWCGKVDIGYTVAGSTDGLQVKITVKDNTNDKTYEAKTFDVAPTAATGAHTVVWDATADGVNKVSQNMVATVSLIVPEN